MKLKAIIKRPDEQYGHVTHISATDKNLNTQIGGRRHTFIYKDMCILSDLFAAQSGKPYNCTFRGFAFCGDIIVLGWDDAAQSFKDLSLSFAEWKELIEQPEWKHARTQQAVDIVRSAMEAARVRKVPGV